VSVDVMQEYDNEAEQAVCDIGIHYTDSPLDICKSSRCRCFSLLVMCIHYFAVLCQINLCQLRYSNRFYCILLEMGILTSERSVNAM